MKGQRGFTLVETLVAFAILAATLVALYEAMGTGLEGFSRSAEVDEAILFAESELDELKAVRVLPQTMEEGGDDRGPYRWRVEPIADEAPEVPEFAASPLRLQKVRLIVTWRDGGTTREIAIERLLLLQRQAGG